MTCGFTFAQTTFPQVAEPVPTSSQGCQPLAPLTGLDSLTSTVSQKTASDLRVQESGLVKWGMRDTQRQRAYDAEFAMRDECRGREYTSVKECQRRVNRILASAWWKERSRVRHVTIGDGRGHRRAVSYGGFIALPKWARCDLVIMHELAHEAMPRGQKHGPDWARMFYDLMRRFMSREIADRFLVECAARNVKVSGKRLPRSKVTEEQRTLRDKQRADRRLPKFTVFCAEHGQHPSNVGYCVQCRAAENGQRAFVTDRFGWSEWRIAAASDQGSADDETGAE